jgi:hypothetical protein
MARPALATGLPTAGLKARRGKSLSWRFGWDRYQKGRAS